MPNLKKYLIVLLLPVFLVYCTKKNNAVQEALLQLSYGDSIFYVLNFLSALTQHHRFKIMCLMENTVGRKVERHLNIS